MNRIDAERYLEAVMRQADFYQRMGTPAKIVVRRVREAIAETMADPEKTSRER